MLLPSLSLLIPPRDESKTCRKVAAVITGNSQDRHLDRNVAHPRLVSTDKAAIAIRHLEMHLEPLRLIENLDEIVGVTRFRIPLLRRGLLENPQLLLGVTPLCLSSPDSPRQQWIWPLLRLKSPSSFLLWLLLTFLPWLLPLLRR
jgi:hypothetical protein